MSLLRVFAFSPNFGLPTSGPFALKLEAWLRMAGIDYERVYEDNPMKGPKNKNPWIEIDGQQMGDTGLIIDYLSKRHDIDLDAHLGTRERAIATSVCRMVEDHFHQVLEWELFIHPAGWEVMARHIDERFPPGVNAMLKLYMRRHFRKQLYARGINRHTPEEVAKAGRDDLDAIEALLSERQRYLFGDEPCVADTSVFGLTAPLVYAGFDAPVANHASSLASLRAYCDHILAEFFPDWPMERSPAQREPSSP